MCKLPCIIIPDISAVLTRPDTLSLLVDALSWWYIVMPWWRYWTCWLWSINVVVVLYLSYALVGPIAESSPLATGIVLLAGPVDRRVLLFWRWRVEGAILRLMIFLAMH